MKRVLIWCEATCRKCGRVANASGYYSPERIKKLKEETKSWEANDEDYGILCPDCKNEKKDLYSELEECTRLDELAKEPKTTSTEEYEAEWQYWSGWSGNHDKRIEDATCSKCGYKHSTIFGSPDLLQDYCPCCKSKMKKK